MEDGHITFFFFFFQAEDGIRDYKVTGVQTCALPILDQETADNAARSAEVLFDAVRARRLPRQILTKKAFENAIAVVMAIGGSTNAVLHLLAIARAAGVPLV